MTKLFLKLLIATLFTTSNCLGMLRLSYTNTSGGTTTRQSSHVIVRGNGYTSEQFSETIIEKKNKTPITTHTDWTKKNDSLTSNSETTSTSPSRTEKIQQISSNFSSNLYIPGAALTVSVLLFYALCWKFFGQESKEYNEDE